MANIGKTSIIWVSSFVMIGTLVFRGRFARAETAKRIHNDWGGYSFIPDKCWSVGGIQGTVESSEGITITPTKKCPDGQQGTWSIGIETNDSTMSPLELFHIKKLDSFHHIIYSQQKKIGEVVAIVYGEVKGESDPLIDRTDQWNYGWTLLVRCRHRGIDIGYSDHLDKAARAEARKNHTPPKSFMELVNSFQCDKAQKSEKKKNQIPKKVLNKKPSHGK